MQKCLVNLFKAVFATFEEVSKTGGGVKATFGQFTKESSFFSGKTSLALVTPVTPALQVPAALALV